ncbi:hypothetical protein V5F34_00875 [Xanthobacter autotrophicus]|uniref:hypothetical protein n=1 Tax=Xanthobacter autotrophicus TaxID=280 RepID=UPI0037268FBA
MTTTDHLDAINERLARARARAASATRPSDKGWFEHEVLMLKRERENELAFLASRGVIAHEPTVEDLLAELDALDPAIAPRRITGKQAHLVDDVKRPG